MKSSESSLVAAAARVLARDADRAASVPADARARAVMAMKQAMRARARRRRLSWLATAATGAAVAAAVAAAIVLSLTGRRPPSPGPTASHQATPIVPSAGTAGDDADATRGRAASTLGHVVVRHDGVSSNLADGTQLARGDHVVTDEVSSTAVTFARGTRVQVTPKTELAIDSEGKLFAFDLVTGSIEAQVTKLLSGERFLVRTADSEIEVHGTAFRVTRVPASAECTTPTTLLAVTEGVVAARAGGVETFVHPGETWRSSACRAEGETSVPARAEPWSTKGSTSATAAAPVQPARPMSNLAKQNDLFATALERKASGDASGAIRTFEELLARYPDSHLTQSAMAERMKLLHATNPARGHAAATEYLTRFPNGFARHDAERILSAD